MFSSTQEADKARGALLTQLIAAKEQELEVAKQARRRSGADAADAEGRNLSRYDTMKEEAQYLEAGLTLRATEVAGAIGVLQMQQVELSNRTPTQQIRLGSIFKAMLDRRAGSYTTVYIVVAGGGGKSLTLDGITVMSVTPEAPIARALLGRSSGDVVEASIGGERVTAKVIEVW